MRTEQDVLKDFEKLGYEIPIYNNESVEFHKFDSIGRMIVISVFKPLKEYSKYLIMKNVMYVADIELQEHKLLNELFTIWGWI